MRMKQWQRFLQEILHLIRMSTAITMDIMKKVITMEAITVRRISTAAAVIAVCNG